MSELPHIDATSLRRERPHRAAVEAPPLGVGFLLTWLSCCAVYLAAVQALAEKPPGVIGVLTAAVLSIGYGAAWAGLAAFIARQLSAKVYASEPGEWLLAILGARLAVEVAVQFIPAWLLASPQGVLAAATSFFLVLPLLSRSLPPLWKAVIATMLLLYAAPLTAIALRDVLGLSLGPLAALAPWLEQVRFPVILIALILAAAIEAWRKTRRTALHWLGVLAWIWTLVLGAFI
ncbi:MAG: hypothetical protein KY475_10330 [Planctomycetes bacterium]|nr:hypothetical protein [Planctomycetota bacterium]